MIKFEKMSFSKLSTYNSCPFHYYLKYVCGNYINAKTPAILYGTLVHYILEQEANAIKTNKNIDYDKLKKIFMGTGDASFSEKDKEEVVNIKQIKSIFPEEWYEYSLKSGKSYEEKARDFLECGIYKFPKYMQEHPELEVVAAELPFEFECFNQYIFNGFIDLVLRYKNKPNHFVIWDIKTKDHKFTDDELRTPLQFVFYCKALRQRYGDDIVIDCFYSLPVIGELQSAGSEGFEIRGEKKIEKLLTLIENKEWKPKPTPLCYWCEFCHNNPNVSIDGKNLCCYFSEWTPFEKSFKTPMKWEGMDKHIMQLKKFKTLQEISSLDDDEIEI